MRETFGYRGHSIDLELSDVARTHVRWTYFIDGRYCIEGTERWSPIDAVRVTALAYAHRSIDVLDSMSVGNDDLPATRSSALRLAPVDSTSGTQRFAAGRSSSC